MLVRRAAAAVLFTGLFILQLSLVGTGAACAMDAEGMGGSPTTETVVVSSGAEHAAHDEPCDHPVSSDQCRVMAPCGALFTPADPAISTQPTPTTERLVAALVAMPPSISFPPERRPPRA